MSGASILVKNEKHVPVFVVVLGVVALGLVWDIFLVVFFVCFF